MIGVSVLVESTVFTSSQRSSRPYGRNHSLTACSLTAKMIWGMGGGGLGVGAARTTVSDWTGVGVAWVRESGWISLLERIALCPSGLPGDGSVVGLGLGCAPHHYGRKCGRDQGESERRAKVVPH